ncbi:unnamed protein product [Effrenium voratum]|uniref:Uncharacterized protein n=1 Tax=Effrenium voratum TaxID=2562239 RepID=A0AA36MSY2_9DINO|nr:unnamed protein product [Effrenium voratum]
MKAMVEKIAAEEKLKAVIKEHDKHSHKTTVNTITKPSLTKGYAEESSNTGEGRAHVHDPAPEERNISSYGECRGGGLKDGPHRHPLPLRVGHKLMQLSVLMTAATSSLIMNMHKENHLKGDFLWEFACAPESWLSQAILDRHLIARRINLSEGYDLFKPDTWRRLRVLRDVHKPKKLWFSLPCTHFCNWVSVNYNTPERKERLEDLRRKDRRMIQGLHPGDR